MTMLKASKYIVRFSFTYNDLVIWEHTSKRSGSDSYRLKNYCRTRFCTASHEKSVRAQFFNLYPYITSIGIRPYLHVNPYITSKSKSKPNLNARSRI